MWFDIKKAKVVVSIAVLLSGVSQGNATHPHTTCPKPTEGISFGFGAGVKLLNLKNVATKNGTTRSHDAMSNTSSPVLGIYARKYMPHVMPLPMFAALEFNYLTDMKKTSLYTSLNGLPLDTGYRYLERWDGRAMLGAQILACSQVDFWAQAGLQVTYFDYRGQTREAPNTTSYFPMDNSFALAPAGGLEMRYSQPNLVAHNVVTDFIVGWTAGYRNAFKVIGTSNGGNTFNIAMNANWNHTFGLKVMFRY